MIWGSKARRRRDFEESALQHLDALFGVALRLTRDPRDAEDLVQDTFVRALRFYDRFEAGTNMRAWLLRVLTNIFINRYRRTQTERRILERGDDGEANDGVVSRSTIELLRDPESQLQQGLVREELTRAVEELPEDFRMAVVLADVYEFSYKEIAQIMDCPVGTVMSRLHRGRKALQTRLLAQAVESGIVRGEVATTESEPADLGAYRRRRQQGEP